jgi:phosphate transport system permease protein
LSSPTVPKFVRLRSRQRSPAASHARRIWRERRELGVQFVFSTVATSTILITLGMVVFLFSEAVPFFRNVSLGHFLTSTEWAPRDPDNPQFGIMTLVAATLTTTLIALAVAVPVGTVVALYLSEFAPHAVRETLKPVLELLSAVPTVVYGYFALQFVGPILNAILPGVHSNINMASAGLVMGVMIIPYVSSLSEDALRSVPMLLREGSYALGGNRVTTALRVVVPSAISGIGAAYILGISRAIGETMIVAVAAGNQPRFTFNPLEAAQTITAYIAQASKGDTSHEGIAYQARFAAGITLFLMTVAFNLVGYWLRRRYHRSY